MKSTGFENWKTKKTKTADSVVLVFGSKHQNYRICSFGFFHFFSFRTQSTSFSHAFIPSFIHSLRPSFLPSFIPSVLPSFIHAFPPVSPTFRHSFPPSCSFIPSYIHVFPHYVIHSGHGWGMGYRPGIPWLVEFFWGGWEYIQHNYCLTTHVSVEHDWFCTCTQCTK